MQVPILLVDDDTTGRQLRKMVLETNGHCVLAVGEAEGALRALQNGPISLVIVDYFLGDTTSIDLAKRVRKLKPSIPILLLSGACEVVEDLEHVDGYLSKLEPIAVVENKIAELLQRGSPRA